MFDIGNNVFDIGIVALISFVIFMGTVTIFIKDKYGAKCEFIAPHLALDGEIAIVEEFISSQLYR